ncbi:MAG: CHAT domain-containing protein [Myxococcota bacterium]
MSAPSTARLQLDLALVGGELRATIARPRDARAPVRNCARRTFDEARVRELREEMTTLLNQASRWGDLGAGGSDLLRRHGQLLFDEVLPRAVKDAIREAGACDLALLLDDDLVFVPWEWMHTGERFLGLDCAVGRLVRTERPLAAAGRTSPGERRKMLVLCDPRGDLLGSYYEGVTLRDRLDAERHRLTVDLRSTEVGAGEIKRILREYDVIHYAGHAEAWPERPWDSGWLVHDGVLTAAEILDLAGGRPFPELVFANACRSGRVEASLLPRDTGEAVYSLASAFLLAGVRHYVGTLWDVPDEAASHFSLAYYEALLGGATHGRAMARARDAIRARYGADSVLWAAWVLYGDPSVACFPPDRPPTSARPPRPAPTSTPPRRAAPHPLVTRGARVAAWRPLAADPPFEMAGAGHRRLLGALAMCTAVTLAALLTLLAARPSDETKAHLAPMALLPGGAEPELFPAPRPESPGPEHATASTALVRPAEGPVLEAIVQRPEATGDDREVILREGGEVRSWDNFRLRYRLDAPAPTALWHLESQGRVQRIHPAGDAAPEVAPVGWTTLPDDERWYYLDDRRGDEVFVLGVGPTDEEPAAWREELEGLERALVRVRKEPKSTSAAPVLRGIGGTRARPATGEASPDVLVRRAVDLLRARYDRVRVLRLRHR